jgi:hypothetical protein
VCRPTPHLAVFADGHVSPSLLAGEGYSAFQQIEAG